MEFLLDGTVYAQVPEAEPAAREKALKIYDFAGRMTKNNTNFCINADILAGQLYITCTTDDGSVMVNASCRDTGLDIFNEVQRMLKMDF